METGKARRRQTHGKRKAGADRPAVIHVDEPSFSLSQSLCIFDPVQSPLPPSVLMCYPADLLDARQ